MGNLVSFINSLIILPHMTQNNSTHTDRRAAIMNIVTLTRLKHGLSSTYKYETYYVDNWTDVRDQFTRELLQRGYISFAYYGMVVLWHLNPNDYIDVMVLITHSGSHTLNVTYYGDAGHAESVKAWADEGFSQDGSLFYTVDTFDRQGNLAITTNHVKRADAVVAKDSFYPWMNVSLQDYFNLFMQANESILVLIGEPGTGKSTFVRSLIHSKNYSAMLAYGHDVVTSPNVLREFHDSDADILVYEDIGNYLGSREKEDNRFMPVLLNAAEGVLRYPGKKIVLSTDLHSIDSIDPALLRDGRCFDIMAFRKLIVAEAQVIRNDLGLPYLDLDAHDNVTLARVLSKETPGRQKINRFAKSVGFSISR